MSANVITIETFSGVAARPYVDDLARLRLDAFKEYPYLYAGNLETEITYTMPYAEIDKAMITVAYVNNRLAGLTTGMPVDCDSLMVNDIKKILVERGDTPTYYYYYGELIVLSEFEGRGLGQKLYETQDALIQSQGFTHVCQITSLREEHHPLKPSNYRSLDDYWQKLGFYREHKTMSYRWPTLQTNNSVLLADNIVELWTKKLG
ncbi:MAG: hypothetical protein M3R00_08120 [Pseudomonadota bacterium]|nr:hypothetical protein [Pseudomonadota bacterium]